jgi:flagellar hook-associated protein 3
MGWNTIYNTTSFALTQQMSKLTQLQEQTASGMRLLRSSDDPSDVYEALTLREQIQSLQTYQENLDEVVRVQELSHNVLQEVHSGLQTVQQDLTQVISDTYEANGRSLTSQQVDAILEQVLSLANTKSLGRYVMGGTSTTDQPFEAERADGKITSVRYAGASRNLLVPVAPGVTYPGTMVGENVFAQNDRQAPVFTGATGAAAGSATSSVRGDVQLVAEHTLTTFAPGAGLAAGTSSAVGDTILGDHTLTVTVNGADRSIALDGGLPVAFSGTEQDLAVTAANGDVVHVDVSGWSGYTGDVAVTGEGRLSIDGGASYTDLTTFADNLAVTDSSTGRILYVDTTGVLRTGTDYVRIPGTHDVFETLVQLRDVLLNEQDMPQGRQQALLQDGLDALDDVMGVLLSKMTAAGARLQALDTLKNSLQTIENYSSDHSAELEDADVVQVASELARTQTLYEMTLAVAAKRLNISLLDFI